MTREEAKQRAQAMKSTFGGEWEVLQSDVQKKYIIKMTSHQGLDITEDFTVTYSTWEDKYEQKETRTG